MKKKQQQSKKMTIDGLAVLMRQGFGRMDKKIVGLDEKMDANHESMAVMVKNAVQGTQDLLVKKIDSLTDETREGFKKVNQEINKINLNLVDVVRQEDFDKLENRVVKVEETLDLKLKKA